MSEGKLAQLTTAIAEGKAKFLVRFPGEMHEPKWVGRQAPEGYPKPGMDMILAVAILSNGKDSKSVTHVFINQEFAAQNQEELEKEREQGIEVVEVDPIMLSQAMLFGDK